MTTRSFGQYIHAHIKKMRFSLRMHLTIGIKATFSKDEGTSFEQFHARYSNDMTADHSNEIYELSISCDLIISFLYNFFLFIILFISILVIFSSTHFFPISLSSPFLCNGSC